MSVSDATANRLERDNEKLEGRLDRIKDGAREVERKAMRHGAAGLTGFALGAINQRQGGTAAAPYSVAGKVPLDSAAAIGLGLLALFTKETSKSAPAIEGAADAAIGIYTYRYGATWEANQQSAAGTSTTAASTTTSGPITRRPILPGQYGPGQRHYDRQAVGRY